MCSGGVWVVSWVAVFKKVICTCSGLLASSRASWVSVTILVGIRFKIRMRSGRICWLWARSRCMTNTFSRLSSSNAGSSFGMISGIMVLLALHYIMYIVKVCTQNCKDFVWMPRNEAARWNGPLWEGAPAAAGGGESLRFSRW